MDVDEDDDFYGTEEGAKGSDEQEQQSGGAPQGDLRAEQDEEGLEEGEEEDEDGSDSVCFRPRFRSTTS